MKIDSYAHILPVKFKEALYSSPNVKTWVKKQLEANVGTFDYEVRFRLLDKYDCVQVLSLVTPPIEDVAGPAEAVDLARRANDEMAELIYKYPDRFVAAVATLPLNDMEATLKEIDRAINNLKFRGVQIFSSINGKPLDSPEFFPMYEKMAAYDLPLLIHPVRGSTQADYPGEKDSKYGIWSIFGWPFETTAAMTRLAFSGVLDKFPGIKFMTHHLGGMAPYFEERIRDAYDMLEMRYPGNIKKGLLRSPVDYLKMFYADTAINGSLAGTACGLAFFGPEHVLFGTDTPFDSQLGFRLVREQIECIERLDITEAEKKLIFEGNARRIFRLPI
ncbi:MAG: amidohydrolase family protein [Syntrophorhabdaceae bacterium]|nr:amidohydrolase family protein [Syntrophorhabdaceae bacterium]MDD5242540.1 amidohydrolase family protein [Syntrophorhabdaceae bacterium]